MKSHVTLGHGVEKTCKIDDINYCKKQGGYMDTGDLLPDESVCEKMNKLPRKYKREGCDIYKPYCKENRLWNCSNYKR